jgi:tetraacyldisaccharide 4'-kinase
MVVSHPDRHRAAAVAQALGADIVVLDDGFQHRRLHRDLDIVLIDDDGADANYLPAGRRREGVGSLARAHFVIRSAEVGGARGSTMQRLPEVLVSHVAAPGRQCGLERLRGARVLAFAGIARPHRLADTLRALGTAAVELLAYPDHHAYSASDIRRIAELGANYDLVVTTEKDLAKLERMPEYSPDWWALRIGLLVEGGDEIVARAAGLVRFDANDGRTHHRDSRRRGGG